MTRRSKAGSSADHSIVLDNEAAQALASPAHRKHRVAVTFIEAAATRNRRRPGSAEVLIPTIVRVEAGLDRRAPGSSGLTRFRVVDVLLDADRADESAALRSGGGSAVDACVAQVAGRIARGNVTVLTSDLADIPRLVTLAGGTRVVAHRI